MIDARMSCAPAYGSYAPLGGCRDSLLQEWGLAVVRFINAKLLDEVTRGSFVHGSKCPSSRPSQSELFARLDPAKKSGERERTARAEPVQLHLHHDLVGVANHAGRERRLTCHCAAQLAVA